MADDIQGLPPGATVGPSLNSQAVEGLPAGATVGPPIQAQGTTGQQQQQGKPVASSTTDLDDISDAFQNEIEKAVGGVGSMLAAPAVHLKNAIVSLAKGNVDETREHFKSALKSLAGGDVLDAQLQSSKQAKDRMMEAAKSGDVLGTVQHAAGVVPGASQVDDAMTKAQENPSTESYVHLASTILPFLLGGAAKMGAKGEAGATEAGETVETAPKVSPVETQATKSVQKIGLEPGTAGQPEIKTPARQMKLTPEVTEKIPPRTMTTPSKTPTRDMRAPEQSYRKMINDTAAKEGLKPVDAKVDIRDVGKNLSDQLYDRAKAGFAEIKKAVGFDFDKVQKEIYQTQRKIDATFGNPELEGERIEHLNELKELESQGEQAFKDAEAAGVKNLGQPLRDWRKMNAAMESQNAVRASTEGREGIINPEKYAPRVEKMYRSTERNQPGRLQQLTGEDVAATHRNDIYAAQEAQQAIKSYTPPPETKVPGVTIKSPALKLKTPASTTPAIAPTESKALYDLIRPNVQGKVFTGGARTNWGKVLKDIDAMKPEELADRFKQPTQVRELIRAEAKKQFYASSAKYGAATVATGTAAHELGWDKAIIRAIMGP